MKIRIDGMEALQARLTTLENLDFGRAAKKAATDIYNMGQTRTPKDTGELRTSLGVNDLGGGAYEVGYAKEYAPHVEYGHRICRPAGHQVGYVEGQYFLRDMVEAEREQFRQYVRTLIEKGI